MLLTVFQQSRVCPLSKGMPTSLFRKKCEIFNGNDSIGFITITRTLLYFTNNIYRLPMKLGEGYVISHICHSVAYYAARTVCKRAAGILQECFLVFYCKICVSPISLVEAPNFLRFESRNTLRYIRVSAAKPNYELFTANVLGIVYTDRLRSRKRYQEELL